MIETESKKLKQAEWLTAHTLSKEQFKQLIQNKIKRAAQYQTASHIKREVLKGAVWIAQCNIVRERGPDSALKTCCERAD